jgi:hypothetical protein
VIDRFLAAVLRPSWPRRDRAAALHDAISAGFSGDTLLAAVDFLGSMGSFISTDAVVVRPVRRATIASTRRTRCAQPLFESSQNDPDARRSPRALTSSCAS